MQNSSNEIQTKDDEEEPIVLNIGGTRFETYNSVLNKKPGSRLAKLNKKLQNYRADYDDYFFDRDPIMFRSIIDFYRNNSLHFPHNVCGPVVRQELKFWEIDEEHVAPCCWEFFTSSSDNQATIELLCKSLEPDKTFTQKPKSSVWIQTVSPTWTFLEDPSSSKKAMLYSYWIAIALLLSILSIIFGNWDPFRTPTNVPRLYFNLTSNPKMMRFENTDPHPALVILDVGLVAFFMIEFIIRAVVCPNKWTFFTTVLNIVDILAVFPKSVAMVIRYTVHDLADRPFIYITYYILVMFDIFRVLRALKFGKYYLGLRVLIVTLRASALEMFFLVFLVVVGAVVFGVAIYYCEIWTTYTVLDMPIGTYWAFVTMAKVGYGDVVPVTMHGRVVAVFCSIAGVLFTGLAVPIVANSFDRYYSQARLMLMRHHLGFPIETLVNEILPSDNEEDIGMRAQTTLTAFRPHRRR